MDGLLEDLRVMAAATHGGKAACRAAEAGGSIDWHPGAATEACGQRPSR